VTHPRPKPTRSELIIDTLAEVAANSTFDSRTMVANTSGHGIASDEALSDVVRQRLIDAAGHLADLELSRPALWERHDWRNTCDFIGERLNNGLAVSRADLEAVLP